MSVVSSSSRSGPLRAPVFATAAFCAAPADFVGAAAAGADAAGAADGADAEETTGAAGAGAGAAVAAGAGVAAVGVVFTPGSSSSGRGIARLSAAEVAG